MRLQLSVLAAAMLTPSVASPDMPWSTAVDTLVYTDTDRVLVVSPQIAVHRALDANGGEVSARTVVDVVSAASVDVVSQATVRFAEVRTEVDLSASKAFSGHVPSVGLHFSNEPDYLSAGGNVGWQSRLGSPDTVLALGYGLNRDLVGRRGTPFAVFSESLTSHTADASLTQVLGRRGLARLAYTLTVQDGYLEKPYRYVPLFTEEGARALGEGAQPIPDIDRLRLGAKPAEEVPDLRVGHAFGLRAMYAVPALRAALQLDYQIFLDSWGILAHTVEPALHAKIAEAWRVRVFGRAYVQGAARFWRRAYVVRDEASVPRYRTLDRDYATSRTWMGGARLEWSDEPFGAYAELSGMWTSYSDYLFLDHRFALVSQVGFRWDP